VIRVTWVDNTLAYIDQASFLGLRALGRGPLIQFTWVYDRPVDVEGLRRFHRNLGHGLLGRRVERSPLPFGRHRWVAFTGPEHGLTVMTVSLASGPTTVRATTCGPGPTSGPPCPSTPRSDRNGAWGPNR